MYSIDLSKNNNAKEIQTQNTCTIVSIMNCIENKLNFLNTPRDLNDIKTAEDVSLAMGFDANKILMSGGNTLLVLETLMNIPVHNSKIKICNLKTRSLSSKDKLQFVFNNLKSGRTLVASMFGSSTTINAKGYATWNYNGSSHAMHLCGINVEKGYMIFDNTLFRKEVVHCDFETFEKSCHGLYAFDISIDGVVQNTDPTNIENIASNIDSKYDYYSIMKSEVPESQRKFNKYEEETSLWKNIKSLIEIYGYRNLKKNSKN